MDSITRKLKDLGVYPIVVVRRLSDVAPLTEALLEGGLSCVEVTFRTEIAEQALKEIAGKVPEMFLGAGTVLTVEQAKAAAGAGAVFILSPGFNPAVVEYCLKEGIRIYPGVCTPSEIERALAMGLRELKFFPAEAMGGVRYLKAVTGPLSMVRFIPTGGVNLENLGGYLKMDCVLACAGSWIAPTKLIEEHRFDLITERTARSLEVVRLIRGGEQDG